MDGLCVGLMGDSLASPDAWMGYQLTCCSTGGDCALRNTLERSQGWERPDFCGRAGQWDILRSSWEIGAGVFGLHCEREVAVLAIQD